MPDHYVNDPGDLVLLGSFDTEYKAHTLRPNVFYAKSVSCTLQKYNNSDY